MKISLSITVDVVLPPEISTILESLKITFSATVKTFSNVKVWFSVFKTKYIEFVTNSLKDGVIFIILKPMYIIIDLVFKLSFKSVKNVLLSSCVKVLILIASSRKSSTLELDTNVL